jgi:ATPase subunit of ABC transporter with duplicated ATPase domains
MLPYKSTTNREATPGHSIDFSEFFKNRLQSPHRTRINLAKLLLSEPNLLLLGKPTNYLDITSDRWGHAIFVEL